MKKTKVLLILCVCTALILAIGTATHKENYTAYGILDEEVAVM